MGKKLITLVSLVLTVSALPACAMSEHPPKGKKPPSFAEMDINKDGELTKDELKGRLLDDFDRFDTDGSGSLTESELPEPPRKKREPPMS